MSARNSDDELDFDDDELDFDMDRVFEAVVAASEGNVDAARWALNEMSRDGRYMGQASAARGLTKIRPADYWLHG